MIEWLSRRWASRAVRERGPGLRPRFAGSGGGSRVVSGDVGGLGAYGRMGKMGRGWVKLGNEIKSADNRFTRLGGLQVEIVVLLRHESAEAGSGERESMPLPVTL